MYLATSTVYQAQEPRYICLKPRAAIYNLPFDTDVYVLEIYAWTCLTYGMYLMSEFD